MVKLKCEYCKKIFYRRQRANKFCSKDCYYKMKKKRGDKVVWTKEMRKKMSKRYRGEGNPNYGNPKNIKGYKRPYMTGKKHPNWKGGMYKGKDGYVYYIKNGKDIPEHRIVMEKYLGRKLSKHEIIHHIDEDRANNNIKNLAIVSRSEHMNIHRGRNY